MLAAGLRAMLLFLMLRPLMRPEAYDYTLPADRIAQRPTQRRGDARLMIVGNPLQHARVEDLHRYLPENGLVVVNESAVVPARVFLTRAVDGRTFELLFCAPAPGQGPGARVSAWVRDAKRLRAGQRLAATGLELAFEGADPVDPRARVFRVVEGDVLETLHREGKVPLPPYIRREAGPDGRDAERYQTVYAGPPGSVAAPTAGLHFDEATLARLDVARITLHVGPGTFLPMEAEHVREHRVGAERFSIDPSAAARIEAARREGRPIIAVGTTVTRALESAAMSGDPIRAVETQTDLVITPEHQFRVVTHLLTNFHLPKSSLLMLVCSFAGHARIMSAYREAVASGYRFYSYGDCMLCARLDDSHPEGGVGGDAA